MTGIEEADPSATCAALSTDGQDLLVEGVNAVPRTQPADDCVDALSGLWDSLQPVDSPRSGELAETILEGGRLGDSPNRVTVSVKGDNGTVFLGGCDSCSEISVEKEGDEWLVSDGNDELFGFGVGSEP